MTPWEKAAVQQLARGSVGERAGAARQLAGSGNNPDVLRALIVALEDPGCEVDASDLDAPPMLYSVAEAAAHALQGRVAGLVDELTGAARRSPQAAFYVARLLAQEDPSFQSLLDELLEHEDASVREAALRASRHWTDRLGVEAVAYYHEVALLDRSAQVVATACEHFETSGAQFQPSIQRLQELEQRTRQRCMPLHLRALLLFESWLDPMPVLVELTVAGIDWAAEALWPRLRRLSPSQLQMLLAAKPSRAILRTWGELGDGAQARIPILVDSLEVESLHDSALLALLRIPRGNRWVLPRAAKAFVQREHLRNELFRHHPQPRELAREVLPDLVRGWKSSKNLSFLRGMLVLGELAADQLPWLLRLIKSSATAPAARWQALAIVGKLGPAAQPAFPTLRRLLRQPENRCATLQTLADLGPWARDVFMEELKTLQRQSKDWTTFAKNNDGLRLAEALAAMG